MIAPMVGMLVIGTIVLLFGGMLYNDNKTITDNVMSRIMICLGLFAIGCGIYFGGMQHQRQLNVEMLQKYDYMSYDTKTGKLKLNRENIHDNLFAQEIYKLNVEK